jgi:hypothetical protein
MVNGCASDTCMGRDLAMLNSYCIRILAQLGAKMSASGFSGLQDKQDVNQAFIANE